MRGVERDRRDQFERLRAGIARDLRPIRSDAGRQPRRPGQQLGSASSGGRIAAGQRQTIGRGAGIERDPDPRVAAVVEGVVEQPRMAPRRDAMTCGAEIGFGRDRILVV